MQPKELSDALEFATSLAAQAGLIAMRLFRTANVSRKADASYVTDADHSVQRTMVDHIRLRYPEHAVLCEEEGEYLAQIPQPGQSEHCWVLDPIDGTRNFVRHTPCFTTSIGLLHQGEPIIGVVSELTTGRTWSASKGQGAFSGGRRMQVEDNPFDGSTIVAYQADSAGESYARTESWHKMVNLRNYGTTALHMALLADGCFDGQFCLKSRMWDIAAGSCLLQEAGGMITDMAGKPVFPFDLSREPARYLPFIAGAPMTHAGILAQTK